MTWSTIRVQRGLPIPSVKTRGLGGQKPAKYPWHMMGVGDSFLFPHNIGRASYSAAIQASKGGDAKFKVYKTDEGYRCWRIE